jgi:Zn-dependent protease
VNPSEPERHEAVEGEYLPPDPHPASGRNWRAAGGSAIGLAVLAAKFKGLIFALLNLKWLLFASKFALGAASFLASIWFYQLFYGWKFSVVFVLLILLHEAGHAVFVRGYGLSVPGIYFIPGLGAFTTFSGAHTPYQQATIAFGGPLFGALGGIACLAYGTVTGEPFWLALAGTCFFLNLLNMIPLAIFDGARISAPIPARMWLAGGATVAALAIAFHWWSSMLLIVLLLGIPHIVTGWRAGAGAPDASMTHGERLKIATAYFGLLALLSAGLAFSGTGAPAR